MFKWIVDFFKGLFSMNYNPEAVAMDVIPDTVPDNPVIRNSLIESKKESTKFVERILGSKETWEENSLRAAKLYLDTRGNLRRTQPRPGTGRTTPAQIKNRAEWEKRKLTWFGPEYGNGK